MTYIRKRSTSFHEKTPTPVCVRAVTVLKNKNKNKKNYTCTHIRYKNDSRIFTGKKIDNR